jgi:uncharacterized protein (DUF1778 family)
VIEQNQPAQTAAIAESQPQRPERRGGRPKKHPLLKKSRQIGVWVTPHQWRALHLRAQWTGVGLTEYILNGAFAQPDPRETREHEVTLRLSEADYHALNRRARDAGLDTQTYILRVMLGEAD